MIASLQTCNYMKTIGYSLIVILVLLIGSCAVWEEIESIFGEDPCPTENPCSNPCETTERDNSICFDEDPKTKTIRYYKCDELVFNFKKGELDCAMIFRDSLPISIKTKLQNTFPRVNTSIPAGIHSNKTFCNQVKEWYLKLYVQTKIGDDLRPENATIKKCMCDEDIYIYHHPLIEMEEATASKGTRGSIGGEGGSITKNYIIEIDGDFPPKFTLSVKDRFSPGSPSEFYSNANSIINPSNKIPLVAFLDSGLDPDVFAENQYGSYPTAVTCLEDDNRGWNFIDDNNITYDSIGHGTLVALSFKNILENTPADYRVLPVKVLDDCGKGTIYSTVCGLYYAKAKGADILNVSWGLYFNDPVLRKAVSNIANDGIKIVSSAGNRNKNLRQVEHYPSGYSNYNSTSYTRYLETPNVIEVSGLCLKYNETCVAQNAILWSNSNYNKKKYAEPAMGYEQLMYTFLDNLNNDNDFNVSFSLNQCSCAGTSYAAPRITAALTKEFTSGTSLSWNSINASENTYSYWVKNCQILK